MLYILAMPLILDSAKLAVEKGHILEVDESPVMKLSAQIIPAMTAALYMVILLYIIGVLN